MMLHFRSKVQRFGENLKLFFFSDSVNFFFFYITSGEFTKQLWIERDEFRCKAISREIHRQNGACEWVLIWCFVVKNESLDLCLVTFEVCPETNTHALHRYTSQIWGTCWFILTSVSLLGATRVHSVQKPLLNQRPSYYCYYTGACPSFSTKVAQSGAVHHAGVCPFKHTHVEITLIWPNYITLYSFVWM